MRLQDIDWKDAWIRVSGESLRETRLPLSQEVGQAIVAYLQEGRLKFMMMRCLSVIVLPSAP
jgi:integrase/recombinase XerD